MRKVGCGIIYYNNSIVICGGYGFSSSELQAGSQFIKNTQSKLGRGWTNEIYMFNITEGNKLSFVCFACIKNMYDITYLYLAATLIQLIR